MPPLNFYQEDLAFVHDQGYSTVGLQAAEFLLALVSTFPKRI